MRWAVLVWLVTIRTVCAIHCSSLSAFFHTLLSVWLFFFFLSFFILHWSISECFRFGIRNSNCILLINPSSVHFSCYFPLLNIHTTALCHLGLSALWWFQVAFSEKRLTGVDKMY